MRISDWSSDVCSSDLIGPLIVLLLVVGLAGGLYPAFYLSRFQPATVLKANTSSTDPQGSGRFRNILVVAQFAVPIGLIICTAIVYSQTPSPHTIDTAFRRQGLTHVAQPNPTPLLPVPATPLPQPP